MTEFGRATASVDALEALVTDLAAHGLPAHACDALSCTFGSGEVKPRGELAAEGDWIIVFGLAGAAEGHVSEEERAKFWEAERIIASLEPTVARMRRKCDVRAKFDDAKERLRKELSQLFPDLPEAIVTADPVAAAQDIVSRGCSDSSCEALRQLIDSALNLANASTYGSKMVERVLRLTTRFDAACVRFKAEVVPRLGVAVASADVDDELRAAERRTAAAAQAAAAEHRAREEAKRPLAELLEEFARGDQKFREQREEKDIVAEWQCVQSPTRSRAPLPLSRSLYS